MQELVEVQDLWSVVLAKKCINSCKNKVILDADDNFNYNLNKYYSCLLKYLFVTLQTDVSSL